MLYAFGHPVATCCCDMLYPPMLRYVVLKCCDRLAGALIDFLHEIKALITYGREGAPANRATRGWLISHTFLLKTHRSVYMLDRVARLPGTPCVLARGARLGGVTFCDVNGSSRAISANRGEINGENMAARSEYFRSYHLPVLSDKQNESQSEEINVIDESQAENRPVPVQEAEIRWKKGCLVGRYVCCA